MRSGGGGGDLRESRAVGQRFGEGESAVNHAAIIAAVDRDDLVLGNDGKRLGTILRGIDGKADQVVVARALGEDVVALRD